MENQQDPLEKLKRGESITSEDLVLKFADIAEKIASLRKDLYPVILGMQVLDEKRKSSSLSEDDKRSLEDIGTAIKILKEDIDQLIIKASEISYYINLLQGQAAG